MTGPVRAKGDDAVYIMPVHWPSFACWEGSVRPRMCATDAGLSSTVVSKIALLIGSTPMMSQVSRASLSRGCDLR